MILHSFRVEEFRSVKDSGWVETEQITALIGTNESGKTNILLPLWKLNPADDGKIDLKTDLPRDKYHIYRNATQKPKFIHAKYYLLDAERVALAKISGYGPDEFSEVIVSRDYDGKYYYEFPTANEDRSSIFSEGKNLLEARLKEIEEINDNTNRSETERRTSALSILAAAYDMLDKSDTKNQNAALNAAYSKLKEFAGDIKSSAVCAKMADATDKIAMLVSQSQKPLLSQNTPVTDYIEQHMPKYVYYSNYGNLDSEIYLPQVIQDIGRTDLGVKAIAKARTLKTLFKYVGLDPKEIADLGAEGTGALSATQIETVAEQKKEREILLSSASSGFTKQFNEWWKQGNYTFEFQADGSFFRIWVSDSIRPERIELESRSTGLQWFFSFYLVFLVESEQHHQNAILLLDEPGVTLHPLAQRDLFLFFENLATNNQILYTTHSPFMVDSNHLERVRSVYIEPDGKTVVSEDLRASERLKGKNQPQSIYPAHAALGLTVSDTLLINCNPVLVEGESDQLYLSALKSLLISKGKISPLKELVFIPTGGVKGIKATSAILSSANESKPFVILDSDKPGEKITRDLKADLYATEQERIISISDYCSISGAEIEDLFPKSKIAPVVAHFLPRPQDVEEEFDDVVIMDKPLCNQIEDYLSAHEIDLETGWKARLALAVKKEILKGTDKIVGEEDPEFEKIVQLFTKIS